MNDSRLRKKLIESGVAVGKLLPAIGPFIGLFDDLNTIWFDKPDLEDWVTEFQVDLLSNVKSMIETRDSAVRARLINIEKKVDNLPAIADHVSAELPRVKDELLYIPNRSEGFLRIILSSWISLGLEADRLPKDFHFAAKYLSDLDCRILLYVFDRQDNFRELTVDMLSRDTEALYYSRELLASLSRLRDFGFLTLADKASRDWSRQEWLPSLGDIDDFCGTLKFLPVIAVMPASNYVPGYQAMREAGSLEADIRSLSMKQDLRAFIGVMSAVRRHPIHGYQWAAVVTKASGRRGFYEHTGWQGSRWLFPSAQSAIEQCNTVLIKDGQKPDWIYVSS